LGFYSDFGKASLLEHGNGKCVMMDATAGASATPAAHP
jgi:hypothetical protein